MKLVVATFLSIILFVSVSWASRSLLDVLLGRSAQQKEEQKTTQELNDSLGEGPASFLTETTLPDTESVLGDYTGRSWRAPDYSGQVEALGWDPEVFSVPEPMQPRVSFWIDIFTKYTTNSGVLHDSLHVGLVYEAIDFTDIMEDEKLTDVAKTRARRARVTDKRQEVTDRLRRLADVEDSSTLVGEDLRYWNMFSSIEDHEDRNKFIEATHRRRLRFQLGQRDRFIKGIYYSGRYLEEMESIFRDAGMPLELTRLPFVESSFNVMARSRVGASGVWQFMPATGRRYMRISAASDERNDPIKATHAAAKKLRSNYNMLGSWPLAVTAYNHGPSGVARLVQRFGTNDIADLVDERHRRFGFASANFYASFLATLIVEKEAEKFFGPVIWDEVIPAKEIPVRRGLTHTTLIRWFEDDRELARRLNPHLTAAFWSGRTQLVQRDFFRVPENRFEFVMGEINQNLGDQISTSEDGRQMYTIAPGETLSGIATQFGVRLTRLIEENGIDNPSRIRPGQSIIIPD